MCIKRTENQNQTELKFEVIDKQEFFNIIERNIRHYHPKVEQTHTRAFSYVLAAANGVDVIPLKEDTDLYQELLELIVPCNDAIFTDATEHLWTNGDHVGCMDNNDFLYTVGDYVDYVQCYFRDHNTYENPFCGLEAQEVWELITKGYTVWVKPTGWLNTLPIRPENWVDFVDTHSEDEVLDYYFSLLE